MTAAPTTAMAARTPTSYVAGDDGALQKGVAWPSPRFTDNNNGTISDNLTGLIWLKNGECLGVVNWFTALAAISTLADGNVACQLTDGSVAGDWRLPNRNELQSLMNVTTRPAKPAGPFINFDSLYWSSTTDADNPTDYAWIVDLTTARLFMVVSLSMQTG